MVLAHTVKLFQAIQGTSMSSPHTAGAGALLMDLHPDWTPGQVRSALMTTAKTRNVFKEDGTTKADSFDYGSGRIDLRKAGYPGLTINATAQDFLDHQGDEWNVNIPSIYIPNMPGEITVQRTLHNEWNYNKWWRTQVKAPKDVDIDIKQWIKLPKNGNKTINITIDARNVPLGEDRHAMIYLYGPHGVKLHIPVYIIRDQAVVTMTKTCDPTILYRGHTTDCTITIENTSFQDADVNLVDKLPKQLRLVNGTVVGADQNGSRKLSFNGTLAGATAPSVDVAASPAPFGYVSLASLGVSPFGLPSNPDDGGWVLSGFDINYLGQNYTGGIWSVNGTLELGTASGVATSFANQNFPDPAIPNNLLAPWWTDLNLTSAGNWYIATLSAGPQSWDVLEWENVPRFGDSGSTFTFQIWLERGTDNIHYTYGPFAGNTADGTTGAENDTGLAGDSYYYDGAGTLPWVTLDDLVVNSVPGAPGETHVITYTAKWRTWGHWQNCAEMTSNLFQGVSTACINGDSR